MSRTTRCIVTVLAACFGWNAAGSTITLEGAGGGQQFRVGEGRLLQLDRDGGVPPWDAPGRVLTRQPD